MIVCIEDYAPSDEPDFSIEMETGTGKTYVYKVMQGLNLLFFQKYYCGVALFMFK
jgi:restriction endonuclease